MSTAGGVTGEVMPNLNQTRSQNETRYPLLGKVDSLPTSKLPYTPFSTNHHTVPTPVNINRFASLLQGYDPDKTNYLFHCLTHGFSLECDPEPQGYETKVATYNHQSVLRRPEMVTQKLLKEVEAGRMSGPYNNPPLHNFHKLPLALIEKKKGSYRLIHNRRAFH
jgi:hypothetical protein